MYQVSGKVCLESLCGYGTESKINWHCYSLDDLNVKIASIIAIGGKILELKIATVEAFNFAAEVSNDFFSV